MTILDFLGLCHVKPRNSRKENGNVVYDDTTLGADSIVFEWVVFNEWLITLKSYPFIVCNEANLDLFHSLQQKIVISEHNHHVWTEAVLPILSVLVSPIYFMWIRKTPQQGYEGKTNMEFIWTELNMKHLNWAEHMVVPGGTLQRSEDELMKHRHCQMGQKLWKSKVMEKIWIRPEQ